MFWVIFVFRPVELLSPDTVRLTAQDGVHSALPLGLSATEHGAARSLIG